MEGEWERPHNATVLPSVYYKTICRRLQNRLFCNPLIMKWLKNTAEYASYAAI